MASDLITLLATDFPDNTVGSITPAILRSYLTQLVQELPALRFTYPAVNLNSSATDNAVSILVPSGIGRYILDKAYLTNLSVGLNSNVGTFGLYTASGGLGSTLSTAATMTITSTSADTFGNLQLLALSTTGALNALTDTTLYGRVVAASSVAVTADLVLTIKPLT